MTMMAHEFLTDFDQVARCGEYDYDWTEGILWRHRENGVLLWGTTGGCSCNDYLDNIDETDMIHVDSWQDAVDLAKGDGFTDSEIADFAAQLIDLPGNCAPSQPADALAPHPRGSQPPSTKNPLAEEPT